MGDMLLQMWRVLETRQQLVLKGFHHRATVFKVKLFPDWSLGFFLLGIGVSFLAEVFTH